MSDKNKITRPPDEQIQRLVIDTIMRQWPSKQSLQYINRFMKNEGKKEIKPRTFQRIKVYMKDHKFDRLFEIAKEGFVTQHLARIDDLELIKRKMWDMFFKLEKSDPFRACQVLVWLMQVQPYLSQYYEASKYIMEKVRRAHDYEKNNPGSESDYIPSS